MGKTYAEVVNKSRDFQNYKFQSLVKEYANKGYFLKDLGEEKHSDRYMFINMAYLKDEKIILCVNHSETLEQLEKVLRLLKFNSRTLPYETRLIELKYNKASDKDYSDLMTEMEEKFNIPQLEDSRWNQKNSDIITLYRAIGNERRFEEENEEDWELDL